MPGRLVGPEWVGTVEEMFVTNHVLAGAILGTALRRRPGTAFVVGIVSHLLMDRCPHWGIDAGSKDKKERFLHAAKCDGCAGLLAMAAGAMLAAPDARVAVASAMVGAALPDLNKPFKEYLGFSPFPAVVDRFHDAIQEGVEAENHLVIELVVGAAMALTALWVLPRDGRSAGALTRR